MEKKKQGRVTCAVRALGFKSFESYVRARSGRSLREMAAELDLRESFFFNFHAAWVCSRSRAPKLTSSSSEEVRDAG